MFGKGVTLFTLVGIKVRLDLSWIVIAILVTWSLKVAFFPQGYPGLEPNTYLLMGVFGALGLFISIILHEFGHAIIARRHGLQIRGITLFIFGGVAEMESEPPSAKAEFLMAIAGPIVSIILCGVFLGLHQAGEQLGWPVAVTGVFQYLGFINGILVIFNMVPAFPLDGGRVLRSALWAWKKRLRWATRIASNIGSGFGIFLIALGIFSFINGAIIPGMWWALIGFFIRSASRMSYQQVLIRGAFEGEPVRRFMNPHPITVSPDTSIDRLVHDYIYKHHHKMFPVVDDGRLLGCVTLRQVKDIPHEDRLTHRVGELVQPCSEENTVSRDDDAIRALTILSRTGNSRLMVVDGNQLVGVLSLKDLQKLLSLKLELEELE